MQEKPIIYQESSITGQGESDGPAWLLLYTRSDLDPSLGDSVHLAVSCNGHDFDALNANRGICYANSSHGPESIVQPWLFRTKEDTYGLICVNPDHPGRVLYFMSDDLCYFKQISYLQLTIQTPVTRPVCLYDPEKSTYCLSWTEEGMRRQFYTEDFRTLASDFQDSTAPDSLPEINAPEGAVASQVFELRPDEADCLTARFSPVANTDLLLSEDELVTMIHTEPDLPEEVNALYSDGSERCLPVEWDMTTLDLETEGVYEVKGQVTMNALDNPFIEQRADPWVFLGSDKNYYFTASYPMYSADDQQGYSRITLRRAPALKGLKEAKETVIWQANDEDGIYRHIWAPEIHQIDGDWYIFFTGSIAADNYYQIRPHILFCAKDEDPMDPASWQSRGRMLTQDEDNISFRNFSLDMTYFVSADKHYVVWAEKTTGDSVLYIATIDSAKPWQLTSKPMLLTEPEFAWEQVRFHVNEGPSVLKREDQIFLCFSAAGTGSEYCVGLMQAKEGDDLLNPASWKKYPYPILTTDDVKEEYGPGHNSFVKDERGEDVFVYHARTRACYEGRCAYAGQDPLYDPCRHARMRYVHWSAEGLPILKMTPEQLLAPANRQVSLTVRVTS